MLTLHSKTVGKFFILFFFLFEHMYFYSEVLCYTVQISLCYTDLNQYLVSFKILNLSQTSLYHY